MHAAARRGTVINTATGIRSTDRVYLEAARSFCASRGQIFTKILIPSALPFIVAGLRLGIGRGLVGVVVGELFGARGGLGFLVLTSSQTFDTAGLWVWSALAPAAGAQNNVHNTGVPKVSGKDTDPGNAAVPGAFNTTALRDVRNTAPYMHNGVLPTLEAVMDFYSGNKLAGVPQLSGPEKADIIAYLDAL